jgi:hypothetical protein
MLFFSYSHQTPIKLVYCSRKQHASQSPCPLASLPAAAHSIPIPPTIIRSMANSRTTPLPTFSHTISCAADSLDPIPLSYLSSHSSKVTPGEPLNVRGPPPPPPPPPFASACSRAACCAAAAFIAFLLRIASNESCVYRKRGRGEREGKG